MMHSQKNIKLHICKFGHPSKSKMGIECDLAFSTLLFTLKKKDKL